MDILFSIVTFVFFVLGAFIGFFVGKRIAGNSKTQYLENEINIRQVKLDDLLNKLGVLESELTENRNLILELTKEKSSMHTAQKFLEERLKTQKDELVELQGQLTHYFRNLAQDILEEKSKKFTEENKQNIGQLLDPLKIKISEFEKKVEDSHKESLSWNATLKTEVNHLKQLNQQITREAESLTKALKGESKTQGTWGEIQLESILEKVGLLKDVHFFKEKNFKTEDNINQRPDYIIKLPDQKYVIIDSKVSLTAYMNFYNAESEEDKQIAVKQHLLSIQNHINQLSERNYQQLHEIAQPDYVLLFVANEPALTLALREEQGLYEKALEKNIVLVSTSTLLATLRTIAYIWRQDLQNKNAEEIARKAGELYDKFVGFSQDLIQLGKGIQQTKEQYEAAMNKLIDGKGNLVRRTEQLKELGARATKSQDSRLLGRAIE